MRIGPKTKSGLLALGVYIAFDVFLFCQGTAEQVLAAFFAAALVALLVVYVVLTVTYLRTGNPAYRP